MGDPFWLEQMESGAWSESASGDLTYTQVFLADLRMGRDTAKAKGFSFGKRIVRKGVGLVLDSIIAKPTREKQDRVEIVYRSSSNQRSPSHRDGKVHEAGDEEFELITEIDEMSNEDALRDGFYESASEYPDGTTGEDIVTFTVMNLVWRKWLAPVHDVEGVTGSESVLPDTLVKASALISNYISGDGSYEKEAPRPDKPLEGSPKFKVVDLSVTQDGNLLLREATLRYRPYGEWA